MACIQAVHDANIKQITVVSNNCGVDKVRASAVDCDEHWRANEFDRGSSDER